MPQNPPFEGEGFSCSRLYTSRPAIACARRPLCGLGGQSGVAIEPTQSKSERRRVDGATLCTQRASNCTIPHHCSHILCCPAACVQRRRCQTRPSPFALHPTYRVIPKVWAESIDVPGLECNTASTYSRCSCLLEHQVSSTGLYIPTDCVQAERHTMSRITFSFYGSLDVVLAPWEIVCICPVVVHSYSCPCCIIVAIMIAYK